MKNAQILFEELDAEKEKKENKKKAAAKKRSKRKEKKRKEQAEKAEGMVGTVASDWTAWPSHLILLGERLWGRCAPSTTRGILQHALLQCVHGGYHGF